MRNRQRLCRLLLGFVSISWMAVQTSAQENAIPLEALRIWQHHNNNGWTQFDRGDYVKAAERFDLAIKEIRPYEKVRAAAAGTQLLRPGPGASIIRDATAEAEPLAKWALTVRDEDKKAKPESVFQCVYVLAMVHKAQKHYADAEPY